MGSSSPAEQAKLSNVNVAGGAQYLRKRKDGELQHSNQGWHPKNCSLS